MKKLCLFCKYFYFSGAEIGYSEYTPGSEVEMYCTKRVWDKYDVYDIRETFKTAETCKKYKLDEWVETNYDIDEE